MRSFTDEIANDYDTIDTAVRAAEYEYPSEAEDARGALERLLKRMREIENERDLARSQLAIADEAMREVLDITTGWSRPFKDLERRRKTQQILTNALSEIWDPDR